MNHDVNFLLVDVDLRQTFHFPHGFRKTKYICATTHKRFAFRCSLSFDGICAEIAHIPRRSVYIPRFYHKVQTEMSESLDH